jgi:hypothetical protein
MDAMQKLNAHEMDSVVEMLIDLHNCQDQLDDPDAEFVALLYFELYKYDKKIKLTVHQYNLLLDLSRKYC